MSISNPQFNALLYPSFPKKHCDSAVEHFQKMVNEFRRGEWDDSSATGGKFVEAVLKALWVHVGESVPTGRQFKADNIINQITNKVGADRVRITIPRACRFAYDIASNRGARHDPDEIAANEMDATVVMAVCAWILSEMVSFAQKGMDLTEAKLIVEGLMRREFPFTESIEGRIYSDIGDGAREIALMVLYHLYPKRMHKGEIVRTLERHDFRGSNAIKAPQRLTRFVDDDGHGNVRLRNAGLRAVEQIIVEAARDRSKAKRSQAAG